MWNPLSLPFALTGALASVPRAGLLLEQAVAQAAALNETGIAALGRIGRADRLDRMTAHAQKIAGTLRRAS